MQIGEFEKQVRSDPCTSSWLKIQLEDTISRDSVDALNDIEILTLVLEDRLTLVELRGKQNLMKNLSDKK